MPGIMSNAMPMQCCFNRPASASFVILLLCKIAFSKALPAMSFSLLGLSPVLLRAIDELGYTTPTPIQSAAIPAVLRGEDVLGAAQTGSGKTAAFALPILQTLLSGQRQKQRQVRALILVPTRELAAQVGATLDGLAKY